MILTIANQKGGVGKSTSARAIAEGIALRGNKVLVIDLDPQRNISLSLGADRAGYTSLDVLTGEATAEKAITHTALLDVIPASPYLSAIDTILENNGIHGGVYRLAEALEPLKGIYPYIVIDTPPSLGTLTITALTASTGVISPAEADFYSLQGIVDLAQTINSVREKCNPELAFSGVFITRYNSRSTICKDMAENMRSMAESVGTRLYESKIRQCTALPEANYVKQTIYTYAPRSNASKDYSALVDEILR